MSRMVSTASAFGRGWFSPPYPVGRLRKPPCGVARRACGSVAFCPARSSAPRDLVEQAKRAEEAGFHALWISDHYHPWNDEQGHSPFVWSVIGAIAQATDLPVTTGVTCPTMRIHPAVIAQAAATSARACSRAASGSASAAARRSTSTSSATTGPRPTCAWRCSRRRSRSCARCGRAASSSHHGRHYTVENARIYDLPEHAAAGARLGLRAEGDHASRRGSATATAPRRPTRRRSTSTARRAAGARARRHQGLLHGRRGRGARDRRTGCGPTRRCRASWRRSCRRRRTSSRRASS